MVKLVNWWSKAMMQSNLSPVIPAFWFKMSKIVSFDSPVSWTIISAASLIMALNGSMQLFAKIFDRSASLVTDALGLILAYPSNASSHGCCNRGSRTDKFCDIKVVWEMSKSHGLSPPHKTPTKWSFFSKKINVWLGNFTWHKNTAQNNNVWFHFEGLRKTALNSYE